MKRTEIKKRPMADTVLTSLEPEAKEYRELDGNGLYLRVMPDGSKSWQLRYKKPDGKWSWLGLGGFGKGPSQLGGAAARKKAADLLAESAASGQPLSTIRQSKKAQEMAEVSFEGLALEWFEGKRRSVIAKTAKRQLSALRLHVFPIMGKRDYRIIQAMEWLELLRSMERAGILEQMARVRAMCREIYDLARVTGRVQHNPLEGLQKFVLSKPAENYAHVPADEFPALLRAIRAYSTVDVSIGLQLLTMLACRPTELRAARWSEFDLDNALWIIPAERMKKRREHAIPLPRQALELLRTLRPYQCVDDGLLFAGRQDKTKPRSDMVFTMALRRMGYEGRQTAHGFRHLCSTALNELGYNSDHIEAQLSHVKGGVRGVYDKSTYLEQRRIMMQDYADYLDKLAAGNVVQFAKVGG